MMEATPAAAAPPPPPTTTHHHIAGTPLQMGGEDQIAAAQEAIAEPHIEWQQVLCASAIPPRALQLRITLCKHMRRLVDLLVFGFRVWRQAGIQAGG
jgi:hypothetical protein